MPLMLADSIRYPAVRRGRRCANGWSGPMRRTVLTGVLGLLLAGPVSIGTADDPPALTPPADLTKPVEAPSPPPDNPPPRVVPAPRIPSTAPKPVIPSLEPIESEESAPALAGPAEMSGADPATGPRFSTEVPSRAGSQPLSLEAVPFDELDPDAKPGARPRTGASRPTGPRDSIDTNPPPAPRRSRLFGWLQPPSYLRDRRSSDGGDSIEVEPRSDPAADAALKRRIERQVRDSVGDRLRSLDVSVVDRNVTIKARVDRFWHRRNVRRTLENLPGLSGYRTRIDVID